MAQGQACFYIMGADGHTELVPQTTVKAQSGQLAVTLRSEALCMRPLKQLVLCVLDLEEHCVVKNFSVTVKATSSGMVTQHASDTNSLIREHRTALKGAE